MSSSRNYWTFLPGKKIVIPEGSMGGTLAMPDAWTTSLPLEAFDALDTRIVSVDADLYHSPVLLRNRSSDHIGSGTLLSDVITDAAALLEPGTPVGLPAALSEPTGRFVGPRG